MCIRDRYNAYRTGTKTVVLCEEEREADEINSREEKGLVGICKYQPSYQLLQLSLIHICHALAELDSVLDDMLNKHFNYTILFLESSDEVLVKRYKLSLIHI